MMDVIRLGLVFALIVLLIRRKLKIGWVLLLAGCALIPLYAMGPSAVGGVLRDTLTDPATVKLIAALLLIRVLEVLLRERQVLRLMTEASAAILRSRRAAMVSMPLLIGMLPSVGGAYFSAPMVAEAAKDSGMSDDEKAFVNYWFRHPWEAILPLYPGILLAAALSGIELRRLIAANLVFSGLMMGAGFLSSMRSLPPRDAGAERPRVSREGLLSFLPVASVLGLVMALGVSLPLALGIVVPCLFLAFRMGAREAFDTLRKGYSTEVVILIAGVMFFKEAMEASGAVQGLGAALRASGIPTVAVLFTLPFVTGLLTGINLGFVGATFPLLVSLPGGGDLGAVAFAFASGFAGVLISPVHVCLVLTREYFGADLGRIYRRMALPMAIVFTGALIEFFVLTSFSS